MSTKNKFPNLTRSENKVVEENGGGPVRSTSLNNFRSLPPTVEEKLAALSKANAANKSDTAAKSAMARRLIYITNMKQVKLPKIKPITRSEPVLYKKKEDGSCPAPLPADENERLGALQSYNIMDSEPEVAFDDITAIAAQICDCSIAFMNFINKERQWAKSTHGENISFANISRDLSFCSWAISGTSNIPYAHPPSEKQLIYQIPNLSLDPRFDTNPLVADRSGPMLRFYAGAPLYTSAGNSPLGTICVMDTQPRQLTIQQTQSLEALARLAVDQMEFRMRNEQIKEAHKQVELLNQKLYQRNSELEAQVQALMKDRHGILDTPAEKVISMLKDLRKKVNASDSKSLDFCIEVIGSHRLYTVDVQAALDQDKSVDSTTKNFLLTQFNSDNVITGLRQGNTPQKAPNRSIEEKQPPENSINNSDLERPLEKNNSSSAIMESEKLKSSPSLKLSKSQSQKFSSNNETPSTNIMPITHNNSNKKTSNVQSNAESLTKNISSKNNNNNRKKLRSYSDTTHIIEQFRDRDKDKDKSNNNNISSFEIEGFFPDKYRKAFKGFSDWGFDVFLFNDLTEGHPLQYATYFLFEVHHFFEEFEIDRVKFIKFIREIEAGYKSENAYHNCIHATDVLLACNYFVSNGILTDNVTSLEKMSFLLAAAIHDYKHLGFNNVFLINTANSLALTYNDNAVLENYHVAEAWQLLLQPEYNFLENFSQAERQQVRKTLVCMVLSTDMSKHPEILSQFQNKQQTGGLDVVSSVEDRMLALKIAIKCADISNPARPSNLYTKWTNNVMEEFFRQGDVERSLNLPVSSFMDRDSTDVKKCQIGFISFIVLPIYKVWSSFARLTVPLSHLEQNLTAWKTTQI